MSDLFQDTPPEFEGDVDPAADFLAREHDELAGIDDGDAFGLNGSPSAQVTAVISGGEDLSEFDTFGDDPTPADNFEPAVDGVFGQDAPAAEVHYDEPLDFDSDPVQNGGMYGEDTSSSSPYAAISSMDRLQIEPEKIKRWREEQAQLLEEKDAAEEKHISDMQEAAKKELTDWYRHRDEQLEKTKSTNRAAEEAYVREIEDKEPGSEFERICKLCDFNPKNSKNTRDVSRFRSILLQLKQGGLIKNLQ